MDNDLISREALKKAIKDNGYSHYFEIFDIIDNAPTVPQVTVFTENADEKAVTDLKAELQSVVEPRPQGEWIFDSEHTEFGNPYGTYKCNKCGGHSSNKYPFCFWCGAKMKGGAE